MYIATSSSIDVVPLGSELEAPWEAFVGSQEAGLLYYGTAYRQLIDGAIAASPCYLVALRSGDVCGVMPLFVQDGPFGKIFNALPYYGGHGAPLAVDHAAEAALLSAYDELTTAHDVAAATIVANPLAAPRGEIPYDLTDHRIGQFTPLPAPRSALMDAFHSKTRNMIRKAEKEGVVVERDDGAFSFLSSVHRENMEAKGGLPKDEAFFQRVGELFDAGDGYRLYVASIDGERVAALLLLYYNGVVEYFTPVIRVDHRSSQPLSLLIYEAMVDAAGSGHRLWNWGGTWPTQGSLHRFKKRWGTDDRPYSYFVRLNNQALRDASSEELLAAYPHMYVLPFSQLASSMAA